MNLSTGNNKKLQRVNSRLLSQKEVVEEKIETQQAMTGLVKRLEDLERKMVKKNKKIQNLEEKIGGKMDQQFSALRLEFQRMLQEKQEKELKFMSEINQLTLDLKDTKREMHIFNQLSY